MNNQVTRPASILSQTGARSRRLMVAGVAATVMGAMSLIGVSHAQTAPQNPPAKMERQAGPDGKRGPMNPEQAEKRFDRMTERLVPDATPEQKAKLKAISRSAFAEMKPLHEKSRAARENRMKLLSAPTIDRKAIEAARVEEQKLADQRSRITTKAFADAAEVLTPQQRVKAAEEMKKHRHHFGHKHGGKHERGDKRGPAPAPQTQPQQ